MHIYIILHSVTSELMFELYGVPKLMYCVDSIMSFYNNNLPSGKSTFTSDGLIISFNTTSTSVIPMLAGKGILSHCKRYVPDCNGKDSCDP